MLLLLFQLADTRLYIHYLLSMLSQRMHTTTFLLFKMQLQKSVYLDLPISMIIIHLQGVIHYLDLIAKYVAQLITFTALFV